MITAQKECSSCERLLSPFRSNRGSAGGRPLSFGAERYKERNTVERCFNKLKAFRAVATRYDKRERI
jgi:transposase